MERRFDITNFEQSLKDQADQLNMIPSRRVWNGIYNNLHPGSRWPSIAMAFLFLFTIMGIGHLNNSRRLAGINYPPQNQSEVNSDQENDLNISNEIQKKPGSKNAELKNNPTTYLEGNFAENNRKNQIPKSENSLKKTTPVSNVTAKVIPLYPSKSLDLKFNDKANLSEKNISIENTSNKANTVKKDLSTDNTFNSAQNSLKEIPENRSELKVNDNTNLNSNSDLIKKTNTSNFTITNKSLADEEQNELVAVAVPAIKENDATLLRISGSQSVEEDNLNKSSEKIQKPVKKRNEKIRWLFYLTPSLTTAAFLDNGNQTINSISNSSSVIIRGNQNSNGMTYNSRFGFEAGTEITYSFWKKLQFVTGAHFSYSGYNVVSNQVHPTFASLVLKQEHSGLPYSKGYMTHYGNGQSQNQISLSNYSLQVSIPVGLQQALFENKNIRVDIATSLEPSYVLKSNAFLISSDGRYYVEDPELLRKLNLSGHAGTFVTFKTQKFNWQLGPTVRYQLLSTYQRIYPVKEHLLDYGIRIGISK